MGIVMNGVASALHGSVIITMPRSDCLMISRTSSSFSWRAFDASEPRQNFSSLPNFTEDCTDLVGTYFPTVLMLARGLRLRVAHLNALALVSHAGPLCGTALLRCLLLAIHLHILAYTWLSRLRVEVSVLVS